MDYEQIRKDLESFVEKLDSDGFRSYVDAVTLKAKITCADLSDFYDRMLEMAKDLMTKDYIIASSKHGELVYSSEDVMIFLDEKGYLERLWMRNPGKNTWRIIPEVGMDFGDDEEDVE
ncbi:MAG: hypothetical protein V9H25_06525 [Candidatus Competibacter sp.]